MPDDPKTDTLSVVEEKISLTKQAVLTGRVRIATQTETVEHRLPAELSSEEICKELSLTPTNLYVQLHRARLRLRECLELNWFARLPTK